jgi:putative spermidine/putrescine transport system ATP-binding protein/mannopine transport system ATP-binding protein
MSDPAKDAAGRIGVDGLVKRYGSVRAVDGVTLAAEPGEFLALLGPSGSGKTTVLMCMAGFETPDGGRIAIGGVDMTRTPPQRRNLGMVFQRYTLFPHMSVLDNIAFPLKMRGVARGEREARARRALDTVRLGAYGTRMPAQLSGGQQQRVALARAIVYEPRVLLMDEPLSALDKALREEMQIEIKRLQRMLGVTVIFVTHDQTEALTMADRIAVLDGGRLQQWGAPRELYETPGSAFVAGFIGETNFLDGHALAASADGGSVEVALRSGGCARASAVGALREGAAVRVAVRPERLRLGPASDEGGAAPAGTIGARIVECIYIGLSTTCIVATDAGETLRTRIAAGAAPMPLEPGRRVALEWESAHARAFPADDAAAPRAEPRAAA